MTASTPPPAAGDPNEGGTDRRRLLAGVGWASAGLAARGALAGALGRALAAVLAAPAGADPALDLQILQTASSLERLAIDLYDSVLTAGTPANQALQALGPAAARDALTTFFTTTRKQHGDHLSAFQGQTQTLGGAVQDAANPVFQASLTPQLGAAGDLGALLAFTAGLEKLATDTYLLNLPMVTDRHSKEILGGVMGVEAQHLATLLAVGALAATPDLIAIPFPQSAVATLPAAVCDAAFPDALHRLNGPDGIAQPTSGAIG